MYTKIMFIAPPSTVKVSTITSNYWMLTLQEHSCLVSPICILVWA